MDANHYLEEVIQRFRSLQTLADKAINQIPGETFFELLDDETNSIAVTMKHVAGNMRSRWTDFLTTDGEKPDRFRDREFVIEEGDTEAAILEQWESGWRCLFDALDALRVEDLDKHVKIRNEPHSVIEAIHRQLSHYAYHVGQIVLLARHFAGQKWQSLSIPRGKSQEWEVSKHGKLYWVKK